MILKLIKKIKTNGLVPVFALVLLLCSCTVAPPDNADGIVISESFGIDSTNDNGPAINTAGYVPSRSLEYTLSNDKSYYIVSGIGKIEGEKLVIPSVYKEKPVKKIGERAFAGKSFTTVVIPDSITHIEDEAFYYCRYLEQVIGGRGIVVLGHSVFENCRALTEFMVYKDMTVIGDDAFYGCYSLAAINVVPANMLFSSINGDLYTKDEKTILRYAIGKQDEAYTIPDSVLEISRYAFAGAYRLSEIEFGKGVTKIGDGAFYSSGIKELIIPDTVEEIGSSAFAYCSQLTSINTGGARKIDDGAFSRCTNLRTVIVGDSARELGNYLFYRCYRLRTVTIGAFADRIGAYSFGECVALRKIDLGGVKKIDSYAFYDCSYYLTGVDIPDSVTEIGYQAFYRCESLQDVTLGSGLIKIGKYAFCRTAISDITLPDGLLIIDDSAFAACENLSKIAIPDSVELIGAYAFCGCEQLDSLVIGKGVKFIGSSAFSECGSLTDVSYRGSEEEYKSIVIEKYNNAVTDFNIKYNYEE